MNRAKTESVNGILVLDFYWYGEHGIACQNGSSYYAFAESEASLEQLMPKEKRPKWGNSAIRHFEDMKSDFSANYSRFNLTESNVIAFVRICPIIENVYANSDGESVRKALGDDRSKKAISLLMLKKWITGYNWIKVSLND